MTNVVDLETERVLRTAEQAVAIAFVLYEQFEMNPDLIETIPAERRGGMEAALESARVTVSFNKRPRESVMQEMRELIGRLAERSTL